MTAIAQQSQPGALATAWSRIWRARRLVERNIMVYRHQWIIIFSGVFEPIFYMIGIGLGIGGIVGEIPPEFVGGRTDVSYLAYVAPALLATAAMNGAVFETIFNVFFKLNYAKTYDGVLATPMGITEIALGEMMWALMRALLYAVAMFVIMLVTGLILSPWGTFMVPAALLVAAAFAATTSTCPWAWWSCRCSCSVARSSPSTSIPSRSSGSCRSTRCTTRSASSVASRPAWSG